MVRFAILLALLVGCDRVFGLNRDPIDALDGPVADEDNDGVADDVDPCPHLPFESSIDEDQDGVSADCDPDDHLPGTKKLLYTFDSIPNDLDLVGALSPGATAGTVELGTLSPGLNSLVVKNVLADTVTVDVGYEILGNSIEDLSAGAYTEIGVYSAQRAIVPTTTRGDACYFGRLPSPTSDPLYLQMNEDNAFVGTTYASGTLNGTTGRLHMLRTPKTVVCTVFRDGLGPISDTFPVAALKTTSGQIAISADRVRVRLRYLFIAYQ